jgi:hypothetical protein
MYVTKTMFLLGFVEVNVTEKKQCFVRFCEGERHGSICLIKVCQGGGHENSFFYQVL